MSIIHRQTFLMLQGPVSPFFARLAAALEAQGHTVLRINLCVGDTLFWRRAGSTDYRGTFAAWPAYIGGYIEREAVTDLVILGEQRPYHLAAAAEARARGVTVTVTDFGYLRPDWLTLERDGMGSLSWFPRAPEAIRKLAQSFPAPDLKQHYYADFGPQAAWDILYNLATYFGGFLFPHYRSHHLDNPLAVHAGTAWRVMNAGRRGRRADAELAAVRAAGQPYWLFPMQMEIDYSIRAYSPYDDMSAPLTEVIRSFACAAPPEGRLVIKTHPFDPGLKDWAGFIGGVARQAGVADRISFVDAGNLFDMIEGARGVVTINSTVGLMALQAHTPTKALGHAIYDVDGLTFQGELDTFWSQAIAPDERLLNDFVRAAAGALHIRGVYYNEPGLSAAVTAAAERLQTSYSAAIADAIRRSKLSDVAAPAAVAAADDLPLRRWAG